MRIIKYFKNENAIGYLVLFGFIVIIFGLILFLWHNLNFSPNEQINAEKFSQYGEFVGGIVGSIWALAGVILFYIALTEQREDFKTNKDALRNQIEAFQNQVAEFQYQRKEVEYSRKIYEEQNKTLHLQQFDSNFYSLLNVYLEIKNNLNTLDTNKDYFRSLYNNLIDNVPFCFDNQSLHSNLVRRYLELYYLNRSQLSHFFKSFYRILKIIDSSEVLNTSEKLFYAKILRSQLTDYEQLILFFNSHSFLGIKSRPLILNYNLLKHLPIFNKIEFNHFFVLQNTSEIYFFSDHLNNFISKHINLATDIDFSEDKIEEYCPSFSCITGIYFNNHIEIRIICKLNILDNNINMNDNDFLHFLNCLIYNRLVLKTYVNPDEVILTKSITKTDVNTIFGIHINSNVILNLYEV